MWNLDVVRERIAVGRLLLNLMLVRHDPPAVIYKKDRKTYVRGLERADAGDPGLLGELLARGITHSVERFILPGLAGPHKLVPSPRWSTRR